MEASDILTSHEPLPAPPAAGRRAGDAMAAEIEARIAAGELVDGSFLPAERDLMGQYGLSRTAVREAIARLASRGVLEVRPHYRPVVRQPGIDAVFSAADGVVGHLLAGHGGVRNLYDTRVFFEAALVRNAALHARREDIVALRTALAANEQAIPDSATFYATDVAFHALFYQIPGNPVFPAVHKAFTTWLAGHWDRMPRSPDRNRVNYLSHREIFTAVLERDADAAEQALQSHLSAAWEYVRSTFETD